jgi:hypothetical protein
MLNWMDKILELSAVIIMLINFYFQLSTGKAVFSFSHQLRSFFIDFSLEMQSRKLVVALDTESINIMENKISH